MKKLLFLFAVLLTSVGAWAEAQETSFYDFSKKFHNATWSYKTTTTGGWYGKVTIAKSADNPVDVVLEVTDNSDPIGYSTKENYKRPYLQAGKVYTISVPAGVEITAYEITTQSTTANNQSKFEYTTAQGPVESETQTTANSTIEVSGLSTNIITLDLSKYTISGTNGILLYNLKLKFKCVHFTYKYLFEENHIKSEEITAVVGSSFPSPDYSYVTLSNVPSYNVSAENEGKEFDINVSYNLPFNLSSSFADATWYYMNIRSNNKKWVRHSESVPYENSGTMYADIYCQWAFMGDPLNGIQVINKAAGDGFTLGYDGVNSNDNVHMKNGITSWTIEQVETGFVLRQGQNQYAHDMGSKLQMWNSGSAKGDKGSVFNVESVDGQFFQSWGNHFPWTKDDVTDIPDGLSRCQYDTEGHEHIFRKAETKVNVLGDEVTVTFTFTGGTQMLMIAGVDLIKDGVVCKKDYHEGKAGGQHLYNDYTLKGVESGEYTLRYFVCEKRSGGNEHKLDGTQGLITVTGATRGDVEVVYNFVLDDEVKESETQTHPYGIFLPEITTEFPYGISATKPNATINDGNMVNGVVTMNIELEEILPFYKSTSIEDATWYLVDMHCNDTGTGDISNGSKRYVWTYVPDANYKVQLPKETTKQTTLFGDDKLWCFIGNAYDGFKIYNKAAGPSLTLNKPSDNNTDANMSDASGATLYLIHQSGQVNNAICFKPKGHTYYLNTQAVNGVKVLKGWNDNDGGSSCRFFTPTDFVEEAILAEFNPEIPACAVGTKKILDRDVHTLLANTLATIQRDGWITEVITSEVSGVLEALPLATDLYELGEGYYLFKGTGTGNNANWYLTHKINNSAECLWAMAPSSALNADYIWKFETVGDAYKIKCCNLNTYFTLKTATNGGDNNTYVTDPEAVEMMKFSRDDAARFTIKNADNENIRTESNGQVNYWSGESNETWYIISATDMEIASTITKAGAATLYTSVPLNIPDGVTAKYVKAEGNKGSTGVLRYTTLKKTIPANTAVVLTGAEDDYTFTVANDVEAVTDNVLFGYGVNTAVDNSEHKSTGDQGYVYALANINNQVGFYHFAKDQYSAGKAYLDIAGLSSGSSVRMFNIFDEETETGIVETENGNVKTENVEIYDLSGRRVEKAKKGIFIVNGKKVIK